MKKRLLSFYLLIVSTLTFAQYTAIPDASFEAYLGTIMLPDGMTPVDDIPNDGQVPTANAAQVTTINMRNRTPKVTNLSGIEVFVALTSLDLAGNDLETIDLSNNTELKDLWLTFNDRLATVDISNNRKLENLDIQSRALETLIFAEDGNEALNFLDVRESKLTEIDLSLMPNLNILNIAGSTVLTHVKARGTTAARVYMTGCTGLNLCVC